MKKNVTILSAFIFVTVCAVMVTYTIMKPEPVTYNPNTDINAKDSINAVLKDSIRYWQAEKFKSDMAYAKLDTAKMILKFKYDVLRKKVGAADADISIGMLQSFLSE